MELLETVERAVLRLTSPGATILVAVSGGVDSTVLLHALAAVAPGHGRVLAVGHVHHGLRGAEADADEAAVAAAARALALPFHAMRVDPHTLRADRSNRERPTVQEAARTLRYGALRELAGRAGAEHVATAHTLDDQAETVLLRLLRGSGPDGLGGMAERGPDGWLIRPLLEVSRDAIVGFAVAHGVAWREDASNRCDDYARNRLRQRWLPGLARDFNPQLLRAIGRLAEAQRRDAEWIESIVDEAVANAVREGAVEETGRLVLGAEGWDAMPEALARRVVRRLLVRMGAGRDVSRIHILRVVGFLRTARAPGEHPMLELPGGLRLRAGDGAFELFHGGDR